MKALPVLDPKAAAIDVGSERLHVSIGGDAPKVFGTFTRDLETLRDWFKEQAVRTVAMEATGVYWLYLYEVLDAAGLNAVVVNGRHGSMGSDPVHCSKHTRPVQFSTGWITAVPQADQIMIT